MLKLNLCNIFVIINEKQIEILIVSINNSSYWYLSEINIII